MERFKTRSAVFKVLELLEVQITMSSFLARVTESEVSWSIKEV